MFLERDRSREQGWGLDGLVFWGAPGHPVWQRTDEEGNDDEGELRYRLEPLGPEQAGDRVRAFVAGFAG